MDFSIETYIQSIIDSKVEPLRQELAQLKSVLESRKPKEYLSAKEVQQEFGISRTTLSRYYNQKLITKHQIQGKVYYSREELTSLLTKI